ncbi:MAG: PilZ domain-containing protein [Nitrospirae bacterium]|nr:PilZ domain-containing protein [Nitrospirota bacterium]
MIPYLGLITQRSSTLKEGLMNLREALRIPIETSVSFSGKQVVGDGRLLDLSTGGCKVASDKTVQKGTFLGLRVQLPDSGSPLEIEQAEVRWALGQKFGVEFLRMRAEEQGRLNQLIKEFLMRPNP